MLTTDFHSSYTCKLGLGRHSVAHYYDASLAVTCSIINCKLWLSNRHVAHTMLTKDCPYNVQCK